MTEAISTTVSSASFPTQAQVVIIGGGVIGCSVAYHLTKLGWRDVVLLERSQLTAGTTWHAAGLIVTGFSSETTINIAKYTRDLYTRLEEETGQNTGFKPVGYIQVASNLDRVDVLRRRADYTRKHGVFTEEISAAEVKEMWPLFDTSDILAGFYTAEDGRCNPIDTTMALAKGARMGGVRILEETKVIGINKEQGRVTSVVTDRGTIEAEYVVNCGGMWARELGKMAGVNVPLHAAEHYYLITEPIEGLGRDMPIVEDPDLFAYYRDEMGGLMLGLFEPVAAPWGMVKPGGSCGIPKNFSFGEIQPDWDRLMPYLETAMKRIPIVEEAGIHKFFCGPESFTPDMGTLMGEAPELKNFFVLAGFNSLGILLGGGSGQVLAQWIVDGYPPVDVSGINIDRLMPFQNTPNFLHDRTVELLGWQYIDWPNLQPETARNVRKSAVYDRLAEAGAYYGQSVGWEYPDWFAPEGVEPKVEYSWGRQNWFEYVAAEHKAAREDVILMDLTHMSKFLVQGCDAERVLNRICANNVAVPIGRIVYTQWLNERGTIEADMTVTRLAHDCYLLVMVDQAHTHVETWLKHHTPPKAHLFITDVTSGYSILNVQGPKSRQLISSLTHVDMSNEAFPYLTMQEIDIGYALVRALRVTYVGELGWELYVPTEFTLHVFDLLMEAGKDVGLKHAGFQALDSLRLEKGYRDYGHDIDNLDTPLEVGLGFAVDFNKPGGFIGKETLLQQKDEGVIKSRLVQFLLEDPEPLLYGGEPIYRDGVWVGDLNTGGYGHTLGGSVGLGNVENDAGVSIGFIKNGRYEIEIAGIRYSARASLRPMYDPKGKKVRR
ncbi:MAG: FAD-dependent oxidoreductase [Chloroflexi bacterium]|nr:FAD-dependent oxidoreductase [Chloroflexota bacterium]